MKHLLLLILFPLTAMANSIPDFTTVDRQPTPITCGWECGLRVQRDTTQLSGGTFANTETTFMVWERSGVNIKSRVFSTLLLTETFQNEGESVPLYVKGVKRGAVGTWGATIEANDPEGKPGALVGVEVDVFATGPATDIEGDLSANGGRVRVGVDIVGGDEKFKESSINSGAESSLGFNVYATANTPWFRWISGGRIASYKRNGLILEGMPTTSGWVPERGIRFKGQHVVGIDFSGGTFQSVVRLKEGQAYSFDEYDDWLMKRTGNELIIQQRAQQPDGTWKHVTVFSVNRQGEVKAKKFTVIP